MLLPPRRLPAPREAASQEPRPEERPTELAALPGPTPAQVVTASAPAAPALAVPASKSDLPLVPPPQTQDPVTAPEAPVSAIQLPAAEPGLPPAVSERLARELRPVVEAWYSARSSSKILCPHKALEKCGKRCHGGYFLVAARKAWVDVLSPEGKRATKSLAAMFPALLSGQVMRTQMGHSCAVLEASVAGFTFEDRRVIAHSVVIWFMDGYPSGNHDTVWVRKAGRFYLAFDGELGEELAPR
jgi:hypothetical protein